MRNKDGYPRLVKNGSVVVRIYRLSHRTTSSRYVYAVSWIGPQGRKMQQFAEEAEALDEARLKAAQLAAGRVEAAEMTGADREELLAARALLGGAPLLSALTEWKKARDRAGGNLMVAAEAWAARNGAAFEAVDVENAVKRFMASKRANGVDVNASYERLLPTFVAAFGSRSLHTISSRELAAWMEKRYPHPVSRNTVRARLVTLWRWARKQGYLAREVMTEAEQTESAREPTATIGTITHVIYAQLLQLVRAKSPEYLAATVIAGFCGLRRDEIHHQKWSDIHLDRKFLRVTKAKRNTPAYRLVPLAPAAIEWLLVCPERKGQVCSTLNMDRVRELARHAKFELPDNCFRHSFISHRVAQTGNVAETALEAGNSPAIIFRHYRELFTKEEAQAWFAISPG